MLEVDVEEDDEVDELEEVDEDELEEDESELDESDFGDVEPVPEESLAGLDALELARESVR